MVTDRRPRLEVELHALEGVDVDRDREGGEDRGDAGVVAQNLLDPADAPCEQRAVAEVAVVDCLAQEWPQHVRLVGTQHRQAAVDEEPGCLLAPIVVHGG